MNQESKSLPRWAQWASGLAFMSIVLTAGGLSLAMNLSSGLSIGIAVAIAFGLSDVTKVLLPIACQAVGWTRHLRATYYVASVVSILCAVCYLADQFGADLAGKENAAVISSNADQQIDDLRTALKSARDMAAGEAESGGCGPKCQSLNDRADNLQIQLSAAQSKREHVSTETVDGKATIFAAVAGTNESDTSRGIVVALIIATLLISELIVHASGAAAAMLGAAMSPRSVAKDCDPVAKPLTPREKSAKVVAKLANEIAKPAKVVANRAYYLQRLDCEFPDFAKRVRNGELSVFAACVAVGLRKAPKNSAKWAKPESYAKAMKITENSDG